MSVNRSIDSEKYMNTKIPKNGKYEHVKRRLDTGWSLTKHMERLEEIRNYCRYRKDETFKHLKVTTFAQLIFKVASVSERIESHPAGSTLLSGVGELNLDQDSQDKACGLVSSPAPAATPYPNSPYLLLDMWEGEQYDHCHIISAYSFPVTMLSRTMNPYTKEVLEYKNAPGKIVIVNDEDELVASQAATRMCGRGFENHFMLCGGLKIIAQKFPSGMTTGSFPASCLASPDSSSVPQQPAQSAEKRWRFTPDELEKIQKHLEELHIPSSSNSKNRLQIEIKH